MENKGEIIIYDAGDGRTSVSVRLEGDTVWLTQAQMAELFEKDQSVIARHIGNVFKEGELEKNSNMQILHNTLSRYKPTAVYNLDVIISVGYRVKSQRGTQFRIWANRVLRDYLVRGYAVSDRLRDENYAGLRQLVQVMGRTLHNRGDAEGGDEDLYPSAEEKAAMLLYLVTKNHSFTDGNKRIAATLFLWFLDNNGLLYHPDGSKRIADNTLVALTLMIAESRTEEKDTMVKVVVNLINKENR